MHVKPLQPSNANFLYSFNLCRWLRLPSLHTRREQHSLLTLRYQVSLCLSNLYIRRMRQSLSTFNRLVFQCLSDHVRKTQPVRITDKSLYLRNDNIRVRADAYFCHIISLTVLVKLMRQAFKSGAGSSSLSHRRRNEWFRRVRPPGLRPFQWLSILP